METFILAVAKEGGLFDFDLTFPSIIVEFVSLTFILNKILFTPILDTMDERKSFVNSTSTGIHEIVSKTEVLLAQYQSLISTEKTNLNTNFLDFNQECDSSFNKEITELVNWNNSLLQKSKSYLIFQMGNLFSIMNKSVDIAQEKIYNYLVN
jgi:hypothetical protein